MFVPAAVSIGRETWTVIPVDDLLRRLGRQAARGAACKPDTRGDWWGCVPTRGLSMGLKRLDRVERGGEGAAGVLPITVAHQGGDIVGGVGVGFGNLIPMLSKGAGAKPQRWAAHPGLKIG
jgi:hypothetical protein